MQALIEFGELEKTCVDLLAAQVRSNRLYCNCLPALVASYVDKTNSFSQCIGIITGYPCLKTTPPTENDGPPGAASVSRMLRTMGKRVLVLTDDDNAAVIQATLDASDAEYGPPIDGETPVKLISFPPGDVDPAAIIKEYGMDYLFAIERCGPSEDGACYTMAGRNLNETQRISRLDQLFSCRCPAERGARHPSPVHSHLKFIHGHCAAFTPRTHAQPRHSRPIIPLCPAASSDLPR
jgi:hypothetical protein